MSEILPRQTFPAFLAAAAAAMGIFAASLLPRLWPSRWCVAAALLLAAGALAAVLARSRGGPVLLPLLVAMLLGAARFLFDVAPADQDIPTGRPVTVSGEIASPPAVSGTSARCLLKNVLLTDSGRTASIDGMLLTTIRLGRQGPPAPEYGSVVTATGILARPPARRNPGEFNLRRFYEAQGVSGLLLIRSQRNVRVLAEGSGNPVMGAVVLPFRRAVLARIDSTVGGDEGEFLKGLLIGERNGLPLALKEAFAVSGVAHILAVSGSNVAVVAGASMLILAVIRCPRRVRPWLLTLGLLFYMMVTGNQPPVVRATVMALVFLWARMRQERSDPYNVLGASALLILAFDPRQLFDVGFQLSFVAVLSLVHLFPRFRAVYAGVGGSRWYRRLALGALDLVALTLAATLGTLPITAAVFGRVSVIGLLSNVIVVPAAGLSVLLGMTAIAAAGVSSWLGGIYGELLRFILHWTLVVVETAGSIPYAAIDTYRFSAVDAIPYYAVLGMVVHLRPAAVARRLGLVCAGAILLWFFLPRQIVPAYAGNSLRITVLDVGQGDAILLQFPGDATMLVDTGPSGRAGNAGSRVIVPFLTRLGVRRLDLLALTHGHDDHIGGLRSVLRAFPVARILVPGDSVLRLIPSENRAIAAIGRTGDTLSLGGARIFVLAPSDAGGMAHAGGSAGNEISMILKVMYGRSGILLTGDAEQEQEVQLISRFGDLLRTDLLKVGHHGSGTGTTEMFLDTIRPRLAAISVGRFNRHGHPSDSVMRRLENRGIHHGRTDEDGALMYEATPDTLVPLAWQ